MSTTHRYFDLFDFIANLREVYVAAQLASSTAWRIDTLLVSHSRAVLSTIKDQLKLSGEVNGANEANALLRDIGEAEVWFKKTGLDKGTFEEVTRLTALRDKAHAQAMEFDSMLLFPGVVRRAPYEQPDLEEVFHRKMDPSVSAIEVERSEISIKMLAEMHPDIDKDLLRQRILEKQENNAKQRATRVNSITDLAWWVYTAILRYPADELTALKREGSGEPHVVTQSEALEQGFACLAKDTRVTLVNNARMAAERTWDRAQSDRMLTTTEFARVMAECLSVQKKLENVLASKNFELAD